MTQERNIVLLPHETMAIEDVKRLANIVRALRDQVFKPGFDFGVIPGTGNKPTLLQPGMEKLMRALRVVPRYTEKHVLRDYEKLIFHYEYLCELVDVDTGRVIPGGSAIGLCTSMESKYRWRESKRVCPVCGKDAIIKGKAEYGGGWLCFKKKEGCGATFKDGDKSIEGQQVGRVLNEDICDQINTLSKMAQKRALGSAIKGAANVSEYFTVDLEDFQRYDTAPIAVTHDDGRAVDVVTGEIIESKPEPAPEPRIVPKDEKSPAAPLAPTPPASTVESAESPDPFALVPPMNHYIETDAVEVKLGAKDKKPYLVFSDGVLKVQAFTREPLRPILPAENLDDLVMEGTHKLIQRVRVYYITNEKGYHNVERIEPAA